MSEEQSKIELSKLLHDFYTELQLNDWQRGKNFLDESIVTAIKKIENNQQNSTSEARTVYQNISTICFVNKIRLSKNEIVILKRIQSIGQPKGSWAGLNMLNTVNSWPGN